MPSSVEDRFGYKVELHIHLDGAVRPETILDIAKKKNKRLVSENDDGTEIVIESVEDLAKDIVLYEPCSLRRLLHSFNLFMPVIAGDKDAVERIAYEFCEDCAKQNIKYTEVRYCPHLLANTGDKPEFAEEQGTFSPEDVVETVCNTLKKGAEDFNITVNTILCCMTHRPEWSAEIVALCKKFKDRGVVAIDSAGQDFEPGKSKTTCQHKLAFQEAFDNGIHRTVHAGENGPWEGVQEAIDDMHAERIGHGYHVTDNKELYERCKAKRIHFEMCPMSSIKTKACPEDIKQHPMIRFSKEGMNFSINTDDPIILDNNLAEDYMMATEMGLTDGDIIQSIFNAARSSFATDDQKKKLLEDLVQFYGEH